MFKLSNLTPIDNTNSWKCNFGTNGEITFTNEDNWMISVYPDESSKERLLQEANCSSNTCDITLGAAIEYDMTQEDIDATFAHMEASADIEAGEVNRIFKQISRDPELIRYTKFSAMKGYLFDADKNWTFYMRRREEGQTKKASERKRIMKDSIESFRKEMHVLSKFANGFSREEVMDWIGLCDGAMFVLMEDITYSKTSKSAEEFTEARNDIRDTALSALSKCDTFMEEYARHKWK